MARSVFFSGLPSLQSKFGKTGDFLKPSADSRGGVREAIQMLDS